MRFFRGRLPEMLELLERMVLIQSGTVNKAGVDRMARLMAGQLEKLGLEAELRTQERYGDVVVARNRPAAEGKPAMLLVGHMDTVFPPDTEFNWFKRDDSKCYGPGVADMKGGLVVMLYGLAALKEAGLLEEIPLKVVCNPDEEVGSPVSRPVILEQARGCFAALVLEAASVGGEVVTGRKGRLGFTLRVSGSAGHAAYVVDDKATAVLELAHKIIRLESLNGLVPGLSVNVGRIGGGIGPNTVAEDAWAQVDVRVKRKGDFSIFEARLHQLLANSSVPGTTCRVETEERVVPMEQTPANRALYRVVAEQAQEMGLEVGEDFRPGCSDANSLSLAEVPVLDGLGPVGGDDHSDQEWMLTDSLLERGQLLALSLAEMWRRQQEGVLLG